MEDAWSCAPQELPMINRLLVRLVIIRKTRKAEPQAFKVLLFHSTR